MKRECDFSGRVGAISSGVRWVLVTFVVLGALALFLWVRSDQDFEEGFDYGFSGEVYRFGPVDHEIVFAKGIDPSVVQSVGEYLEQIEYFSPAYGGVIQILSIAGGFDVYLTYPRQYWDRSDFRDEVASIREDLEANVLREPTRIILVDEDEEGIHSMNLNSGVDAL